MYRSKPGWAGSLLVAVALLASRADACLTFCLQHEQEILYGRNFDWPVDVGVVVVNPRHVHKTAFVLPPEKPLRWTSRYGSITFNQFSREVPVGGMNEHGLVIESMVSEAVYPRPGSRKAINELQWIQYHLDTCKSVDEVLEAARRVRIVPYAVKLHYLVSDASGQTAVVEFLRGKLIHYSSETLPIRVLANRSYDREMAAARSQASRFGRAASLLKKYTGQEDAVGYAFGILDAVAQDDATKWQVVYDITRRQIRFRTLRQRSTKLIAFTDVIFEHATEPLVLDVNIGGAGSVQGRYTRFTAALNDELIRRCLREFQKIGIMQHITPEHVQHIRRIVASCKYDPTEGTVRGAQPVE